MTGFLLLRMERSNPIPSLVYHPPRAGYLPGEVVTARVQGIDGQLLEEQRFRITKSPGSGFAGQVYQAHPAGDWPAGSPAVLAVKVLRPRSGWKLAIRETLFWITYQTAFAPRLREAAVRAGLLWQTMLHAAAEEEFQTAGSVARPVGYYWDASLASYVEVHEWVPSRTIRYETDDLLLMRWLKKSTAPPQSEMACKKVFMDRLAGLCRAMGAEGLARQYDWFTFISQANVLTRDGNGTAQRFCAVDCRPGLAFPFFLPLSPAHLMINLQGLRRGILSHYDECDLEKLDAYLAAHPALTGRLQRAARQLRAEYTAYRAGLPDLWQRGLRVLTCPGLRQTLRAAAAEDWLRTGLLDLETSRALTSNSLAFGGLLILQCIPVIGPALARLAGNAAYQAYTWRILQDPAYRQAWLGETRARDLAEWQAAERIHPAHIDRLSRSTAAYLVEKTICGWLPGSLHRLLVDPAARRLFCEKRLLQPLRLLIHHDARVAWLEGIIQFELDRGVLENERAEALRDQARQPQMKGFLRDLGFTAALDVFSRLVYLVLGLYAVSTGDLLPLGLAALGPVPPSGPPRMIYILALLAGDLLRLLLRRRVPRAGRLILARLGALLLAPWRWVGNLFPVMEMSAYYPRLALLLADYHIEQAINSIPVLGGRGKLLEYWAFQACYNLPMSFKRLVLYFFRAET